MSFLSKSKTKLAKFLLIVLAFSVGGGYLLKPEPAHAIPVEIISNPVKEIKQSVKGTASVALMQLMQNFMDKIAYDAAKAISSGGKGKKPLFHQKSVGEYLKKTAKDSAADAIDTAFKQNLGYGICQPPNFKKLEIPLKLNLGTQFGLGSGPGQTSRNKIDCSWTEVQSTWTDSSGNFSFQSFKEANPDLDPSRADEILRERFRKNVSVSKSDFGVALNTEAKIKEQVKQTKAAKKIQRMKGDFKAVKSKVANTIKTPSKLVREEAPNAKERQKMKLDSLMSTLGNDTLSALLNASGVFISTLGSDLLNQLMNPQQGGLAGSPEDEISVSDEYATTQRRAADDAFSFLQTSAPQLEEKEFNLINKFATCPTDPSIRGRYNCIIGNKFRQLLERVKVDGPMTIQEAISEGLLDPNKPLIPPEHAKNSARDCYKDGYCYSNIKKLRKVRVLPLGFQIAAKNANVDQLSTNLGKVVNNFNNCETTQKGNAVRDPDHPYCHLIDPNWLIKVPKLRCEGSAEFSSQLAVKNTNRRRRSCINISSCVQEGENGCEAWGYCIKEEKQWDLPGDTCQPRYNTCTTYFDNSGQAQSYLNRTLEYGTCSEDNVGCSAYSIAKDNQGNWITSLEDKSDKLRKQGKKNTIYFDNDIEGKTCSADSWGCSGFYSGVMVSDTPKKTDNKISLREAPDYLGCYDTNPNTDSIDRPQTIAEARQVAQNNSQCSEFAQACVKKEVGCREWEPIAPSEKTSGRTIPGQIGQNTCSRSCVGYEIYRQLETEFSPAENRIDFIPRQAQQCNSTAVGCSEFTNLNKPAQGGEDLEYYTELKSCENPTQNNQKTFYTWQGKEGEGFQLITHTKAVYVDNNPNSSQDYDDDYDFVQNLFSKSSGKNTPSQSFFSEGSPKYDSFNKEQLTEFYQDCNQQNYQTLIKNPLDPDAAAKDCRAFHDEQGNIYYRLESKLRDVSSQCHELRKTETNLEINEQINSANFGSDFQQVCKQRGGTTSTQSGNVVCSMCRGGGVYKDGHCIYKTISTPGGTNSCASQFKGCRAYQGTTAGNESIIVNNEFNPSSGSSQALQQALSGWSSTNRVSISNVALQARGRSLKTTFQNSSDVLEKEVSPEDITNGGNVKYELTFWASGSSQQLTIELNQKGKQNQNKQKANFTKDLVSNQQRPLSVGSDWQEYELTASAQNIDETTTATIRITSGGRNTDLYLDNFKLTRLQDTKYLIQDSWKRDVRYKVNQVEANVPKVCDNNPTDGLPGSALGCTLYQNNAGEQQAATEFKRLCRENAVGCKPVYPTHNNSESKGVWYNVKATTSTPGAEAKLEIKVEDKQTNSTTNKVLGTCQRPGKTTCFIDDKITFPNMERKNVLDYDVLSSGTEDKNQFYNEHVVSSTVIIPADPTSSDPIYLTDQQEYSCSEDNEGCIKAAKEEKYLPTPNSSSYKFGSEQFILNQPEDYTTEDNSGTLCRSNQLACKEFTHQGNKDYFKDPKQTGGKFCVYKKDIKPTINGKKRSTSNSEVDGWFKEDIGVCEYDNKSRPAGIPDPKLCKTNDGCTVGSTTGTCKYQGTIPCYENNRDVQGNFKIWSNKAQKSRYKGFVGKCPSSANMCRKFVDRADKTREYPKGEPYYRIYDDKLKDQQGQCEGKVNPQEGCVLFDKTDDPTMQYSATATYKKARNQAKDSGEYELVEPVTSGNLDSNIVLKVDQTRQCKEWWSCSSRKVVYRGGEPKTVCTDFQRCSEANSSGVCTNPINISGRIGYCEDNPSQDCTRNSQCSSGSCVTNKSITTQDYISRDTSFHGVDYSGNSVLDMYNISNLKTYSFSDYTSENQLRTYLAYEIPDFHFGLNQKDPTKDPFFSQSCKVIENGDLKDKKDWTKCGAISGATKGRCWSGKCIKPAKEDMNFKASLNSTTFDNISRDESTSSVFQAKVEPGLIKASCKVYPQEDAPFPQSVVKNGDDLPFKPGRGEEHEVVDSGAKDGSETARYNFISYKQGYNHTNVCQNGNCSCMYRRIEYENGETDFWRINTTIKDKDITSTPQTLSEDSPGICTRGKHKGQFCQEDIDCGPAGSTVANCSQPESVSTHLGSLGFCLERDRSITINGLEEYACLTWYPAQGVGTSFDIFNNYQQAGYVPSKKYDSPDPNNKQGGGELFCKATAGVGAGEYNDSLFDIGFTWGKYELTTGYGINTTSYNNRCDLKNSNKSGSKFLKILRVNTSTLLSTFNCLFNTTTKPGKEVTPYLDNDGTNINPRYSLGYDCSDVTLDTPSTSVGTRWAWMQCKDNNQERKEDTYTVLETMAKGMENIGQSLSGEYQVLRFENYKPKDRKGGPVSLGGEQFAPIANNHGTVFYPPRFSNKDYREQISVGSFELDNQQGNTYVGASHSPLYSVSGKSDFLWRSQVESNLTRQEIEKIHFVPLAYPGGAEEANPTLGTLTFRMNFDELDDKGFIYKSARQSINKSRGVFHGSAPNNSWYKKRVATYKLSKETGYNNPTPFKITGYHDLKPNKKGGSLGPLDLVNNNLGSIQTKRNKVHNRYVAVWANAKKHKKLTKQDNVPKSMVGKKVPNKTVFGPDTSPFADGVCKDDKKYSKESPENWIAIGMDFNRQGEFLGYITRWCSDPSADDDHNGIKFAVIAKLEDQCVATSRVYKEENYLSPGKSANKAWTNRVWRRSPYDYFDFGNVDYNGKIDKNNRLLPKKQLHTPYGSLFLRGDKFNQKDLKKAENTTLNSKTFGMPFSCQGDNRLPGSSLVSDQHCGALPINKKDSFDKNRTEELSEKSTTQSQQALNQLFAKTFNIANLEFSPGGRRINKKEGPDVSSNQFDGLKPPRIYSVNPATPCNVLDDSETTDDCLPAEKGNITINGKTGFARNYDKKQFVSDPVKSDKTVEHLGENGDWSGIIGEGSLQATMKFFAFADKNKMPIKRVAVDWDDGSGGIEKATPGSFKNRKPFCGGESGKRAECYVPGNSPSSVQKYTGMTCQSDYECQFINPDWRCGNNRSDIGKRKDEAAVTTTRSFGNASRACQEGYFQRQHTYTCTNYELDEYGEKVEDLVKLDSEKNMPQRLQENAVGPGSSDQDYDSIKQTLNEKGFSGSDKVCVYEPKVQVLDNWGWCNGSCDSDNNPDNGLQPYPNGGCYNSSKRGVPAQCNLERGRKRNPWTKFKGKVIVIPRRQYSN